MILELVSVDFDALPADLLPEAKEHMRVEFDRDDNYIRGCVARAIAEVEAVTDLTLSPSQWRWKPSPCDDTYWREFGARAHGLRVPKTPVLAVCAIDANGVQTPATLEHNGGTAFVVDGSLDGEYLIYAGYQNKTQMPPSVQNPVLMIAASLYENRESLQFGSMNELPDMARRLLSGLWRPAC